MMMHSRIVQRRNKKYNNASSTLWTVNNLKLGCCLPLILVVVIIQDVWNHITLIELDNNDDNNPATAVADSTIQQNLLLWTLSEYWTRNYNASGTTAAATTPIEREKSTKTWSTALAATTHGHHPALRNDEVLVRQERRQTRNDSNNNNDTLFGGAIGMDGGVGYVPANISPRLLAKSSNLKELFQDACQKDPIRVEGKGGHRVLSKVQVVQATATSNTTTTTTTTTTTPHLPRLLCMVYTYSKSRDNLQAIVDTWSEECDGFLAASNETLPSLGAINIVHQGPESYKNMWQKVRSMWSYVYDHYYEDYDYFHMYVLCTRTVLHCATIYETKNVLAEIVCVCVCERERERERESLSLPSL